MSAFNGSYRKIPFISEQEQDLSPIATVWGIKYCVELLEDSGMSHTGSGTKSHNIMVRRGVVLVIAVVVSIASIIVPMI